MTADLGTAVAQRRGRVRREILTLSFPSVLLGAARGPVHRSRYPAPRQESHESLHDGQQTLEFGVVHELAKMLLQPRQLWLFLLCVSAIFWETCGARVVGAWKYVPKAPFKAFVLLHFASSHSGRQVAGRSWTNLIIHQIRLSSPYAVKGCCEKTSMCICDAF